MSKYIPGNQKHLSLKDRKYIERSLNNGCSFKDIARFLCKDPTTISKEVKLHRVSDWYHKGSFLNTRNFCIHRYNCRKTNVCRKIILCNIKCTSKPAPISLKNSVTVLIRLLTFVMDARKLSIVVPLHTSTATMPSLQNASTRNVCLHPELDMSVRTLYSYLNDGILTARNVDLKRKVKFKPRKVHKTQIKDRTVFQGRMFSDFQKLELDHFAEMDIVHSSSLLMSMIHRSSRDIAAIFILKL